MIRALIPMFRLLRSKKAMSWQVLAAIIIGLLVTILVIIWIAGLGKTGTQGIGDLPF